MIIIFQETPSSVLKAALLARLEKGFYPVPAKLVNTLFAETALDCSEHTMASIKNKYELQYGPLTWPDTKKGKEISTEVYYALRHKKPDSAELAVKVISQALLFGPDYVQSRVSQEARKLYNRARQVTMEIHRAFGFVRLVPVDGNTGPGLLASVKFEHRIHDIVLRYFSNRQKNTAIYLLDGDKAYYMNGKRLTVIPMNQLPFCLSENTFQSYWDAYYDSQFIEGRKNLALARKHIPRKLWSWVQEGEKFKS